MESSDDDPTMERKEDGQGKNMYGEPNRKLKCELTLQGFFYVYLI